MKKSITTYLSKSGTTKQFSKEIADYLSSKGINNKTVSIDEIEDTDLSSFDYVFLGCWTKGLMIIAQHPDAIWQDYISSLSFGSNSKIGLFTTYKIATGSMFSRMEKCLPQKNRENILRLKSKNGELNQEVIPQLEEFINQGPN